METVAPISLVLEVMSSAPACVQREMIVSDLLELFDRYDYNAFPVTEEESSDVLVGIVTKLDVLRALRIDKDLDRHAARDVLRIEVGEIMRPGVVTVDGDLPIDAAADLMLQTELRSLPVVHRGDDGRPRVVGIVSRGDLIRGLRFATHGAADKTRTSVRRPPAGEPSVPVNDLVPRWRRPRSRARSPRSTAGCIHCSGASPESSNESVVTIVDIVAKRHRTVADERGQIHQVDRHPRAERDSHPTTRVECAPDAIGSPIATILQDEFRQRLRIGDAHTAMTLRAARLVEEEFCRRIVEIDVEVVRKDELHASERIVRSRPLPDPKTRREEFGVGEHRGIDDRCRITPSAEQLKAVPGEVLAIASRLREDLVDGDRARDVPVRRELHVLHRAGEDWRSPVHELVADDDGHRENARTAGVPVESERRNVHDHEARTEVRRQPSKAFEVGLDFLHPARG